MIQFLASVSTHLLALALYPGLVATVLFGGLAELSWKRLASGRLDSADIPRRMPTPAVATVAVCAMLAAVQLAAPFNPVPGEERSVVVAAIALAFTPWIELAASVDVVAEPGMLLIAQVCWLLAVLGPAVQPEILRPQVLGNVQVPGLIPVKLASGFLYLLCLPALLRLWPFAAAGDRRSDFRIDVGRTLCWLPYCGLFTTLFISPSSEDLLGLFRFLVFTFAVGAAMVMAGWLLGRGGPTIAKRFYGRAVPGYAAGVLALVVATTYLMR